MKQNNLLDEVYNILKQDNIKLTDIWVSQIFLSWRWWFQVLLAIVPWLVWIKIRNKKDTARLLFVGLVVMMTSNFLDVIGATYNLWHYDWKDFPFIPIYMPWDLTLFPISVMIMLQFKPNISKYIKAIVFSFLCSFVFEPLFSYLSMYHRVNWKYWYSFIIYNVLYLLYDYIYNSKKLWKTKIDS
jgi:hypothetical protein